MLVVKQAWHKSWQWLRREPASGLAVLLIAGFSAAYLVLVFSNYADFWTGIDLAGYNQALWNLVHGRLPFNSFKGFVMWGDHAHFILVLLAPLYAVWQDARLLLAVQVLAFTTSGWALWRVARHMSGNWIFSLALLYAYLAFIGMQYALNFDFHPSVLTAAALAWFFYAWHFGRWRLLWVTLGLGLVTREDAATIFFMLGLWMLGISLLRRWRRHGAAQPDRSWRAGAATAAISLTYFLLVGYVVMPIWTPDGVPLVYLDSDDKNPVEIVRGFFTYPDAILQNIVDTPEKRTTLHTLAYSFSYLPLLSPMAWLASAPIIYARFNTAHDYRWLINNHSNANIAPLLAFGALFAAVGIVRLLGWSRQRWLTNGAWLVLAVLLVMSVRLTAWSDVRVPLRVSEREDYEAADEGLVRRRAAFRELAALIPAEDGVTASSGFTAHLSERRHIVNYPELPPESGWVIVSHKVWAWPLTEGPMREDIDWLIDQPQFELVAERDDVWLFRRK